MAVLDKAQGWKMNLNMAPVLAETVKVVCFVTKCAPVHPPAALLSHQLLEDAASEADMM